MTRRSALLLGVGLCVVVSSANRARAHNGPAEPPSFTETECVMVVDKRVTTMVELPYTVGFDDVLPEDGHIRISDSKTHQFYAFRGAVVPWLPDYQLRPWSPLAAAVIELPLWIDRDDLSRAEAANLPTIAPDFHAEEFVDDVLHDRLDLALFWLAISPRVPITLEQASRGVRWDVTAVPPGLYQVASFTFSPPYNAWEPRPGWIKIVDETTDLPVVTVDTIDASVFDGQGRRVSGCVDAADGSKLEASYSLEGSGELSWQPFAEDVAVEGGAYELCFHGPKAVAGQARIRVGVRAPDGSETVSYAPDRVVLIGTPAACNESKTVCCEADPAAMEPAAQPSAGGPAQPMAAGAGAAQAAILQPTAASPGCMAAPQAGAMRRAAWALAAWLCAALGVIAVRRRRINPSLGARLRARSARR